MEAPAPYAAASPSVFGRMSDACRRNSGVAAALLVLFALLLVYLFAVYMGWLGSPFGDSDDEEAPAPARSKKKSKKASKSGDAEAIDDLIAEIESS